MATDSIKLGGKTYIIEQGSYRFRDITDFAPRAQTPGGSVIMSELGLYQPYLKGSWHHGMGFLWEEDEAGYLHSYGLDTRNQGFVQGMTTALVDDTVDSQKEGFTVFNGDWYSRGQSSATGSGVRKYSSSTWSNVTKAGGGNYAGVNFILGTASYLFVCPDSLRIEKINTSGTASTTGVNANSTDYKWLCVHQGKIYAGKDASAIVYYDDNEDLSGLAGDTGDDPDHIVVGGGRHPTLWGISWLGKLLVATNEGIYQIGDDNIARSVIDFSSQISSTNFRSAAIHNNNLIFAVRDQVFQWNGTRYVNITPKIADDSWPYTTYGLFDNFVAVGDYLYCTARTNATTYDEMLLCWDGVAWFPLQYVVSSSTTDSCTAMGYDVVNNRLWYHLDESGGDNTYYIQFQDQSNLPYDDYSTSGALGQLITSRMDMGFRRVKKSTPSVIIETDNCDTGTYIQLDYRLDGDSDGWREWGGTGNGRCSSAGVHELFNPRGGQDLTTLEYNYANFRFQFFTDDSTNSPVLEGFTTRFIMRPDVIYGHQFQVNVADSIQKPDGGYDIRTAKQMIADLKTARDSKKPVRFVDPWGDETIVYISAVDGRIVELTDPATPEGAPSFEAILMISLVELG